MTDTAVRPYGPTQLGVNAVTIYTVPASPVVAVVVRSVRVVNTTSSVLSFTMSIGLDAASKRIWNSQEVLPATLGEPFDWSGFMVLLPNEVIQAFSSAQGLTMTISGVQIS